MTVSSSKAFSAVSLSSHQAQKIENMMKQQVQDAILARSVQAAKDDNLDSEWRFVGSHGHLTTFKLHGSDPFSSTSSWATTLEKTTRATACNLNDRSSTGSTNARRRSTRTRQEKQHSLRQTVGALCGRRGSHNPPLESFRCFGHVQGNYRDIVSVHHAVNSADFAQQQKLLSPSVIDGAVLRTIRATHDSYLGIKWLVENTFSGKRDICFVEMVGYTTDNKGQEVGFVAFTSVDVPECPDMSGSLNLKRVRMKRTMLVVPTPDALKATSEIFVMEASEGNQSAIIAHAQHRLNMAILNDISLVIDSQNLVKQTLILRENWVPDESSPSCIICSRKFHFVARRRHHCRMCGDVICKTCYVNRSVPCGDSRDRNPADTSAICQTKFCLRCVVGLRDIDDEPVKFSPLASKMLSLTVDTISTSSMTGAFEEFLELNSSNSNPRAYFTVYKSTAPISAPKLKDVDDFYSYGSSKYLRSTLSTDSLHSKSYSRLRGLSRRIRCSSTASASNESEVFRGKHDYR